MRVSNTLDENKCMQISGSNITKSGLELMLTHAKTYIRFTPKYLETQNLFFNALKVDILQWFTHYTFI